MPSVKVSLDVEVDGQRVSGFPLVRRVQTDEAVSIDYEKAADNDSTTFTTLPIDGALSELQVLILRVGEEPVTLRLDAQTDAGLVINAGGFVCLFDVDIDAAAATNAKVNNPDATDAATIRGIAAGT